MKPLKCRVNWNEQFSNDPSLEILVDKFPDNDQSKYKIIHRTMYSLIYYSETEGLIRSFYHTSKDQSGYGGGTFKLNMEDGSQISIKGPWSISAPYFNEMGYPCMDVAITDNEEFYETGKGGIFYACKITLNFAKEAIELCEPKMTIACYDCYKLPKFVPMIKDNQCIHSFHTDQNDKQYRNDRCPNCHEKKYDTSSIILKKLNVTE